MDKDKCRGWDKKVRYFYRQFKTNPWNKKDKRFFSQSKRTVLAYEDAQKQQWLMSVQQAYNRRPNEQTQTRSRDKTLLDWLTREDMVQ